MADDDPDPRVLAKCPKCGKPLAYVAAKSGAEVYLYVCRRDGLFTLEPHSPEPIPVDQSDNGE
jgi:hypothetical protein